jgi:isoquinoline 1-oxidoreductase subunit beta
MRILESLLQASPATAIDAGRRQLLKGMGAGLTIGLFLPRLASAESGAAAALPDGQAVAAVQPDAFIRIAPDNTVTVICKHIEFGQGAHTGLATLVAEELGARWSQMRAESAPADVTRYANSAFGIQGTGGSTAMANAWLQMRKAGAAARAMLIAAAAEEWGIPATTIAVKSGQVVDMSSGQRLDFGDLAEAASRQPVPLDPPLKDPANFRLIGRHVPRLDSKAKSRGLTEFTMDVYREGQQVVVVAHPPRFGSTVADVDDTAARAVTGVRDVRVIPQGVAVYADNTWSAIQGRNALEVKWDDSAAEKRSSEQLLTIWREAVARPGLPAAERGDVEASLASATTQLEASYEFPFLAHAPMEPLDAVLELKEGRVTAWMGSQLQTIDHQTIAAVMGLPPENVTLNTLMAGGSFGRRAQPDAGFAAEAAAALKALGRDGVVKLVYTREDDITGGRYRPLTVHRLRGGLDDQGRIIAWDNTIATQSIMAGSPFEMMIQKGIDPTSVEGSRGLPYAIPNFRCTLHNMECGVPPLWWRSVGHTHTAYATETFLDELLALGKRDPVEGRLALLADAPRLHAVLQHAAEIADWGARPAEGRARGVAVHKSFDSYVAQIVEVGAGADGLPRVFNVWCAVDCGMPINPDVIGAQMEGGIGYGLGAALHSAITLEEGGTVLEKNFDRYGSLRINEMPKVKVSVLPSAEPPTGVGEPGVPPIAPAVANAWRVLTGRSLRRLPFAASV